MKIEKISNNQEKYLLLGLITSDKFCKEIIPILDISLFKVNFARIVVNWCVNYYKKYSASPKKNIKSIFKDHENDTDPELFDLIEDFLSELNDKYEREAEFNEDYAIDQAIKYLKTRKLKCLKKDIDFALKNEQLDEAEEMVESFSKIEKDSLDVVDIFEDHGKIREALEHEDEVLFRLPGNLGDIFGDFRRGDLIGVAGPGKRGKSFWLIELAIKSLLYGHKVLFYSFEMTKTQMIKRIFQNILSETAKPGEKIKIPLFEWDRKEAKYIIKYKEVVKNGISIAAALSKAKKLKNMIKTGNLKLICAPPESMTITDIANNSDKIYKESGFAAGVFVFDYLDIIRSDLKGDYRHKIDDKWKGAKNLALAKHAAVFTATHTNKGTYKKDVGQDDMSEDTRKMNHVSVMIGLNQNKEEKKAGIMRLQSLANRHEHFTMDDVVVLYNLAIGKPFLDAKYKSMVDLCCVVDLNKEIDENKKDRRVKKW